MCPFSTRILENVGRGGKKLRFEKTFLLREFSLKLHHLMSMWMGFLTKKLRFEFSQELAVIAKSYGTLF